MIFQKNIKTFILIVLMCLCLTAFMIYHYHNKVTKNSIINEFNRNYDLFSEVQKYLCEENALITTAYKKNKEIIISTDDKNQKSNILSIKPQIEELINNLNFVRISVKNGSALRDIVVFEKTSTGGLEQGIVFIKNDDGKYGMEMVKIMENWYYYSIGYT